MSICSYCASECASGCAEIKIGENLSESPLSCSFFSRAHAMCTLCVRMVTHINCIELRTRYTRQNFNRMPSLCKPNPFLIVAVPDICCLPSPKARRPPSEIPTAWFCSVHTKIVSATLFLKFVLYGRQFGVAVCPLRHMQTLLFNKVGGGTHTRARCTAVSKCAVRGNMSKMRADLT